MKLALKLEELVLFIFGFYLFMNLEVLDWWWFFILLLLPDIGMLGYLVNNKMGALSYNVFHHRGLAIVLYLFGMSFLDLPILKPVGVILFSHIAMDRIFGYGLKYEKGFRYTHLGVIGKNDK